MTEVGGRGRIASEDSPDPGRARTLDEYVAGLRRLRLWAGKLSASDLTRRVHALWRAEGRPRTEWPARTTVWDCFRFGRRRPNPELMVAVVRVLVNGDPAAVDRWRRALMVVLGEAEAATYVTADDRLPDDLAQFTGRDDLIGDRLRAAANDSTVAVSALEGMAGIGKTALAVHLSHRLVELGLAGDGVLWVNLRGFDPELPPADPATVLESFLRLRGVAGYRIPPTLAGRAAAYRAVLAGTRTLVVLDNAADERQVDPLLPRSPGCLILVTSRRRLAGLGQVDHVPLDVFSPAEALDLLRRTAGPARIDADPPAAARIAELLGYLPLALTVIGRHLHDHPEWTLSDYQPALPALVMEGGMRTALDLSARNLPNGVRRLLRLLALHPGHEVDSFAAAALADLPEAFVQAGLDLLVGAYLLEPRGAGRYGFHDLVLAYARDRLAVEEPPSSTERALSRLFGYDPTGNLTRRAGVD